MKENIAKTKLTNIHNGNSSFIISLGLMPSEKKTSISES